MMMLVVSDLIALAFSTAVTRRAKIRYVLSSFILESRFDEKLC